MGEMGKNIINPIPPIPPIKSTSVFRKMFEICFNYSLFVFHYSFFLPASLSFPFQISP